MEAAKSGQYGPTAESDLPEQKSVVLEFLEDSPGVVSGGDRPEPFDVLRTIRIKHSLCETSVVHKAVA